MSENRSTARANREVSVRFLHAFCAGEIDALEPLLAQDLVFVGPLLQCDSRRAYLDSLRRDRAPEAIEYDLLRTVAEGPDVGLLYRLKKPGGALLVGQWNRFLDGRIAEITLTFDASGFADG